MTGVSQLSFADATDPRLPAQLASRAFYSIYACSIQSLPPTYNPEEKPKGNNNREDVDGVLPALASNLWCAPVHMH
ncbi:hypothetical protein AX14_006787 [Amanita brunnescens Koide BX004]|nr:hypothetical protein AX14_006787 [Amanita brunnescens Koide BX004]